MAYKPEQVDSLFGKIILEMISGRSLKSILRDENMPSINTFYDWIDSDEKKMNQYARATTIRADLLFEEIIDISDDSSQDCIDTDLGEGIIDTKFNAEFVQRSRLRVDARKWVVSKMNPKKYGDKQEIDHKNNGESFVPTININVPK